MLLLPLDNRIAFAERHIHLSPFRHFLLGLLYLLTSGGGQIALAFESAAGPQTSIEEYIAGHGLATTLEARLSNERGATGRTSEAPSFSLAPVSVWVDPYVPPILSAAAIGRDEADRAYPTAEFLAPFARAPPVCW